MSAGNDSAARIAQAVDALGSGPLTQDALARHIAPLFARVRDANRGSVYLANHSLGRPLDVMEDDVREGLASWYTRLGGAWDVWLGEMEAYRARLARLLGAPRTDSVVPKTSAGQGLRAVLNTYDVAPRVVATRGEFDSLDLILREYARRGRITLIMVEPRNDGHYDTADIVREVAHADLVVLSEVLFNSGQRLDDLDAIVAATHRAGGRLLLDVYHSLGVLPVDVASRDVDFAVGGSYKYLRGGPGACFLYVHPRHLDAGLRTLDTGWFAKRARFDYTRPDPPELGAGGDAFLESTPPIVTFYQARAGQLLTLGLTPERLRAYSLARQRDLIDGLSARGIAAHGAREDHGAFVVVQHPSATTLAEGLRSDGIVADARGPWLRLCPDVLTTSEELERAATSLAQRLR